MIRDWLRSFHRRNRQARSSRLPFRPGVETLELRLVPASFLVTNTQDAGAGSLRQAILDANANAASNTGLDIIQFDLGTSDPGYNAASGPWTIQLQGTLDPIQDTVLVDGWSQNGAGPEQAPVVAVDGGACNGQDGMQIAAVGRFALVNFNVVGGDCGCR
jgi:hypothetical protein